MSVFEVVEHLEANSAEIIEGPVRCMGATGPIMYVYFRDPEDYCVRPSHTTLYPMNQRLSGY